MAACSRLLEKRNAGSSGMRALPPGTGRGQVELGVLVQEPLRCALEHSGEEREQLRRGCALAALDHAQIGDRRGDVGLSLDAAHRELLQRQPIASAQRAQLGTEKVTLAQQFRHRFSPRSCLSHVKLTV